MTAAVTPAPFVSRERFPAPFGPAKDVRGDTALGLFELPPHLLAEGGEVGDVGGAHRDQEIVGRHLYTFIPSPELVPDK